MAKDIQYWKVNKVCKDKEDQNNVIDVLRKNYKFLMQLYK